MVDGTMKVRLLDFVKDNLGDDDVLITCGLPGTYKTETTEEIAKQNGYTILRTDLIRLEVLKNENIFDTKVASNMTKRKLVYEEMFLRADKLAKKGVGVILDATFVTHELRLQAAGVAAKNDKRFIILQTSCPQEVSINRILRRTKENYESNALTEEAYINNKKKFESVKITELEKVYPGLKVLHFIVDTTEALPELWFVIDKTAN
jgi:predicted kinase